MKKVSLILLFILAPFLAHGYAQEAPKDITHVDKRYGFSITYPSNFRVIKNIQNIPLMICFPKPSFPQANITVAVSLLGPTYYKKPQEIIDIHFKYSKSVLEKKDVVINDIKFLSVVQAQEQSFWFFKVRLKIYMLIATRGSKLYVISYGAGADAYDRYLEEAKRIMYSFRIIE